MLHVIEIGNKIYEYNLVQRKHAKNIRLTIKPDLKITVSAPGTVSLKYIQSFLQKNIEWIKEKIKYFERRPKSNLQLVTVQTKAEYKKLKQQALMIVNQKLKYFNSYYKFTYYKVSIRNQKTRWGSCSQKGNLNFNLKIALLPEHLADYLVVHELCHLGQFNHSHKFWNLVSLTIPDYVQCRRELKSVQF